MSTVIQYFTIMGIWIMVKGQHDSNSKEKRILLNDPSYIQQQFDHLQSEFQDLLVKVNVQQNTIATQQSTINSLESKLSNESSTVAALQSKLTSLQSGIDSQHNTFVSQQTAINSWESKLTSLQAGKGVSFVRWGRKDCPRNFDMVYTGYAGGSWFADNGAAVDYLCMPHEPIWGPNKDRISGNSYFGYVYGAEYESPAVYRMAGYQDDVPCAFCHSSRYSTQAMIPGRTACYPGWTEAYHGDLSCGATHYSAASQYVCVDQDPQSLDGGAEVDNDGKLFYAVQAKCGALRCPPYEDGKLLSCVICVK